MASELEPWIRWIGPPAIAATALLQYFAGRNSLAPERRRKAAFLLALSLLIGVVNVLGNYLRWPMTFAAWLLTVQMIPGFILVGWDRRDTNFDTDA